MKMIDHLINSII